MSGVSTGSRSGFFESNLVFANAVTLGVVSGASRVACYGHTPNAAANTDVWEGAGLYPFQAASSILEILSASANDTAAGTGARTVTIQGLDNSFNPITEVVTMNGTTPVATVNSFRRVNFVNVTTAGTGGVNAGDLTLRLTGAGATQAIVRALYGFAKQAIYTVPAGFTLLVTDLLFATGGTGTTSNITYSFTRVTSAGVITTTNEYPTAPLAPVERVVFTGAMVPSTTTLTIRVTAITTATSGYAAFNGLLVDNTKLVGM
jgi:hypothetical protein